MNRAITLTEGKIGVAVVNGDLTVKRLRFKDGTSIRMAENPHFRDRIFAEGEELEIWGVVVRILHKVE